jgi:hypothetical protein
MDIRDFDLDDIALVIEGSGALNLVLMDRLGGDLSKFSFPSLILLLTTTWLELIYYYFFLIQVFNFLFPSNSFNFFDLLCMWSLKLLVVHYLY